MAYPEQVTRRRPSRRSLRPQGWLAPILFLALAGVILEFTAVLLMGFPTKESLLQLRTFDPLLGPWVLLGLMVGACGVVAWFVRPTPIARKL